MADGPYLIVFRSRLKPGVEAAYAARADAVYALAANMPGMLSSDDYTGTNGERLSIIVFDTAEHLRAWREHTEHVRAQQEGRETFYESYAIDVCRVERSARFQARDGQKK